MQDKEEVWRIKRKGGEKRERAEDKEAGWRMKSKSAG